MLLRYYERLDLIYCDLQLQRFFDVRRCDSYNYENSKVGLFPIEHTTLLCISLILFEFT